MARRSFLTAVVGFMFLFTGCTDNTPSNAIANPTAIVSSTPIAATLMPTTVSQITPNLVTTVIPTTAPSTTIGGGTTSSDIPSPTGKILWTDDGGKTWTVSYADPPNKDLKLKLTCVKPTTCFASTYDGVNRVTKDGGKTWNTKSKLPSDTSYSLECVRVDTCFYIAKLSYLDPTAFWITTNGGNSWTEQRRFVDDINDIEPLSCPTITDCKTTARKNDKRDAQTVITDDAGKTWKFYPLPQQGDNFFGGIKCPTKDICYAWAFFLPGPTGVSRIISSKDGGKTWPIHSDYVFKDYPVSIDCPTPSICFAVGNNAIVLKTENAGQSWRIHEITTSQTKQLKKVVCLDVNNCLALDEGKSLQITDDGGTTWHDKPLNFLQKNDFMTDLYCFTPRNCLATALVR